jgi:drug/metabolite transporter (DMT)-like permease
MSGHSTGTFMESIREAAEVSHTAIFLILASSLAHAGWNLIAKRISPSASFFLIANAVGPWIFFPWVVLHPQIFCLIDNRIWAFLILTGLFQALYCLGLAGAYRHGDLSVSYPVSRSLPVILVPLAAVFLGRGDLLGAWFFAGSILVLAGGMLVSTDEIRSLKKRFVLHSALPMALCAAIGTTGYSLVDDQALRILRICPGKTHGTVPVTLVYAFLESFACVFWIGIFILLAGRRPRGTRVHLGWTAGAGILMSVTYGMVLLAMAYSRDVSLIVAFRQVSILAGALMGFIFLREQARFPKVMGLIMLLTGLLIVALS